MVRSLYGLEDTSFGAGSFVLSVQDSECDVKQGSRSKFNRANVNAVVKLILENHKSKAYDSNDIVIITLYKAQQILYSQLFHKLAKRGTLPVNAHPKVATSDSMQGKEAKVVIVDWVVSAANRKSDLGFTCDDHRANVAQSRMQEVIVNVIPMSVGNGALAEQVQERIDAYQYCEDQAALSLDMLQRYGSDCWLCGAKIWNRAVHVLPRDDKSEKFHQLGLKNFRAGSHLNGILLPRTLLHVREPRPREEEGEPSGTLNDESIPWDTRIRLLELLELYRRPLDDNDSEKATLPAGGRGTRNNTRKNYDDGAPGPSRSKKKKKKKKKKKRQIEDEEEEEEGGGGGGREEVENGRELLEPGEFLSENQPTRRMSKNPGWIRAFSFCASLYRFLPRGLVVKIFEVSPNHFVGSESHHVFAVR
ncbi:hypothetical protein VTN00DRAFT_10406 [Thermoascus crustaceus]|uniref:uncharacterized protein n=1 Tax=Thermoascus crustaceus TaxID=5088 RepID=UPI0037428F0B